ncbi:hypothetical protein OG949_39770 [Streptomyces scopuliridis]|nr:hypothetical protein [Streptomyces scopuliridis]WSB38348.1 hypothetical protein OG949_39770 [Streptomyces scopuliridis]
MTVTLTGHAQVVGVVARPDDAEITFYGARRCWRDAGATVTVVIATHGTNGVSRRDSATDARLN